MHSNLKIYTSAFEILSIVPIKFNAGVPSPPATRPLGNPAAQQEVSKQSFICTYSHSPLLVLWSEIRLLSDQWRYSILTGV